MELSAPDRAMARDSGLLPTDFPVELVGRHGMALRDLYAYAEDKPMRHIRLEGAPYLERYYLGRNGIGDHQYLHRFVGADADRELHNHPWEYALTMILRGRYEELTVSLDGDPDRLPEHNLPDRNDAIRVVRNAGYTGVITRNTWHRIIRVVPETWTLFTHHPAWHTWGWVDFSGGGKRFIADAPHNASAPPWWETAPIARYDPSRAPLTLATA